jgi:hypothetical protein
LWSEQFDNAYWTKTAATISANSTISADGNSNADKLIENSANASHLIERTQTGITSGTTYSLSIFAKKSERNFAVLGVFTGESKQVFVNLTTGAVTSTAGTWVNTLVQELSNGWFRITGVFTAASTTIYPFFAISNNGNSLSYLGDGTSGLYVWGAQLEAGAYPTSYIPTTSASVTRNADVLTRNNIFTNGWITASGGTWFVELKNNISLTRSTGADIVQSLGVSNGTDSGIVIRTAGTSRAQVYKYVSGSPILMRTTAADIVKIAVKWNGTSADIFENGVKVVSASSFTTTNMNFLQGSAVDFPKIISSMALWPTPLTDDELIQLTAI